MKYVVSSFEIILYYYIWASVVIWLLYKFFEAQTEIFLKDPFLKLSLRDLTTGWTFLNREKDISEIEWSCWKYYIQTSWLYLTFQFIVSEVLRRMNTSTIKYWYILSSIFFISFYMGTLHLLMLIQPLIYFTLLLCGGKRISIWVTSVLLLSCYNSLKYKYDFWQILDDGSSQEEKVFLLISSIAWIELRCISYSLDFIERAEKNIESEDKKYKENMLQVFKNLFSYVLYLPVLYLGPIIMYEDFENSFQLKRVSLWARLKRFTIDIVLFSTYSFLLELAFHFIYFNAMQSDIKLIKQLPTLALAGGGIWVGLEFYAKYVISFGTTSAFARLDNMEPPPTPRCIARIHLYSNMWRYFDVGLYKFLQRYIYKPCYSMLCKYMKLSKLVYKLTASLSTFGYIFLWHGTAMNILIWSILNYICVTIELSARVISKTAWYKNFKSTILKTEAMEVRFIAALCAPLLAASAISNFYFVGGTELGGVYVGLLEWPALQNLMLVLLANYCCSHVSMSLLDVPSRTDRPRIKVE